MQDRRAPHANMARRAVRPDHTCGRHVLAALGDLDVELQKAARPDHRMVHERNRVGPHRDHVDHVGQRDKGGDLDGLPLSRVGYARECVGDRVRQ